MASDRKYSNIFSEFTEYMLKNTKMLYLGRIWLYVCILIFNNRGLCLIQHPSMFVCNHCDRDGRCLQLQNEETSHKMTIAAQIFWRNNISKYLLCQMLLSNTTDTLKILFWNWGDTLLLYIVLPITWHSSSQF